VNQHSPQRRPAGRRRRWAEIATIVSVPLAVLGLVVAFVTWRTEVSNGRDAGESPVAGPGGTTSAQAPAATTAASGRLLTALQLRAGAGNIKVTDGGRTVTMPCGTNNSEDTFREVEYWLRGAYRGFTAQVEVSGVAAAEVRTQLEVLTDQVRRGNVVLSGAQTRPVSAGIEGGATLQLRLTCEQPNAVVTIRDATVLG
jgi:hypothetical protein